MRYRARGFVALLFLILAPSAGTTQQKTGTELAAALDAMVQPEADAGLLSGIILVARGDRILIQRSYGFSNWELRVPVSPSSRFAIASITKIMTATVADLLAKEGRVDLDAPVNRFIPGFPGGPRGGQASLRLLLQHQSGVPHRVTSPVDETQRLLPADIVERVMKKGLLFEPGSETLYSSAGYTTLARVIEIVEQKPFAKVLEERIFRPAGMTRATDETSQQLMPGRVMPYRFTAASGRLAVASAPYKDLSFLAGAGSIYATAEDLLHLVNAMRAGTLGKAAQEQVTTTDDGTWRGWYGRTNTEASVDVLPAEQLTFVFLANLQSAVTWQLRAQIRNLLQGRPTTAIQRPPAVAAAFESPRSFVGLYGNPASPVRITEVESRLFRDENEFYPIEGGRYCVPASGSVMRFRREVDGKVDAIVTVSGSGQESVLLRNAGP